MGRARLVIFIVYFLAFLSQGAASAASHSRGSHFVLDLGGYVDNIEQRLKAPAGYASEVSTLSGFARIRYGLSLGSNWYLEPQFALMLPWTASADGATKTFVSHFNLDLSVPIFSFLSLRTGPTIYNTLIWGTGGAVELNNGAPPNTDTFYTPDAILVSFAFMGHAGLQFNLSEHWLLNFDAYGLQMFSKTRRSIHGAVSLGWVL